MDDDAQRPPLAEAPATAPPRSCGASRTIPLSRSSSRGWRWSPPTGRRSRRCARRLASTTRAPATSSRPRRRSPACRTRTSSGSASTAPSSARRGPCTRPSSGWTSATCAAPRTAARGAGTRATAPCGGRPWREPPGRDAGRRRHPVGRPLTLLWGGASARCSTRRGRWSGSLRSGTRRFTCRRTTCRCTTRRRGEGPAGFPMARFFLRVATPRGDVEVRLERAFRADIPWPQPPCAASIPAGRPAR